MATTFQWRKCDASGLNCSDIAGATGPTYTLPSGFSGSVRVVADGVTSNYWTPAGPVSGTTLFNGDFNKIPAGTTTGIAPTYWNHYSDPDTSSPNPPQVINDPTGVFGDRVLALTVDPSDGFVTGSGTQSSRVDIYENANVAMAREGLEVWFLWESFFPSQGGGFTGGKPYYRPTNGDWNWHWQWHNASSIVGNAGGNGQEWIGGIITNSTTDPSNPRFHFRGKGGPTDGLGDGSRIVSNQYIGTPLVYDHWYTIVGHTIWSKDASIGLHEIWLDGVQVANWHMPTLIYIPGGADDVPNFEISNYRWMGQTGGVNWSSTIFFRRSRVGTTRANVEAA